MKYLIDHRYKTLNSLMFHVHSLVNICKRGQSEQLQPSIELLQKKLPELEAMSSPPFNKEEIEKLGKLKAKVEMLLNLPEDLETVAKEIDGEGKALLQKIDPFTFSLEDTLGVRKSRIVEFLRELQLFLNTNLLDLEGKAKALIDAKQIIKEVLADISRVKKEQFSERQIKGLQEVTGAAEAYIANTNIETTNAFLSKTLEVEKLFL